MISLFTNTASLTAQRYSNRNYRSLSHTAAKMASGNRIVKASDDAAGGAIGASLKGNISSLQQAGRNASQGASLLQVADGAIQNMNDILVRMRVLATQVVNDTLSTTERQYAHAEFNQARLQIDQIANGVRWNGAPILNSGARAVASPNTVNTTSITPAVTSAGPFTTFSPATITGYVSGPVTAVTVIQASSGADYNFSITIGTQIFKGTAVNNAAAGPITFTSTTNSSNTFQLTTAAALGSNIPGTLAGHLTTFFGVSGTPVTFVPATAAAYAPMTTTVNGVNGYFPANPISKIVGNVIGAAKDVTVTQAGIGGVYTIDVTIGNQVFRGNVANNAGAPATILFKSLVNDQAGFTLSTITNALPNNNAALLASDLKNALQIGGILVPISFKPGALVGTSAAALLSGNMASTNLSSVVKAGGSVANGIYTLTSSYNATTGAATLRVQGEDGIVYERILDKVSTYTATDTVNVRFFNGLEIAFGGNTVASLATDNLGDNVNATGGQANDTVSIVVSQGTANALTFQIGELSTDVIVLTFSPLTADGLGLTPANIETLVGGQKATNILNNAIVLVNNALSEVGAVQNRMDYIQDNIATSVENQSASKSTFTDADMAAESTEFAKFQALNQAAISMLAQTNRLPQTLLDVLPRG
jgi:flagellin-like hook-associated protein FlgL